MSTAENITEVFSSESLIQQTQQPRGARVFLFEQCDVDIQTALRFGPIYPLFILPNISNRQYNPNHPTRNNRPCIWDTNTLSEYIIQKLEEYNYNPEVDYILIAGQTIPVVMFAVTVALNFGDENTKIRFLFWSSRDRKYIERKF